MRKVIERLSSANKNALLRSVKKVKKIKTLTRQPAGSVRESS